MLFEVHEVGISFQNVRVRGKQIKQIISIYAVVATVNNN
jgi:hypothetical protein